MTSKLTREQMLERARENVKALKMASRQHAFESAREEILADLQLAEYALARLEGVDSEPVAVTDDMAYAFHHALTDSMIGADDVEEIKTGLRAVFANLTAPVVSSEYPDRLPCSVLLEPGLRFCKGIKTSTMLAALARRSVYESDFAALSPEERAEFQAGIEGVKALIAQPVPVAPVCTCPSGDGSLRWPCPVHPGRSPENPGCWCLTCRPVTLNDMRFVVCPDCGNKRCPRANDHRNACTGSNETGQEGSAYPAAPQEVKHG